MVMLIRLIHANRCLEAITMTRTKIYGSGAEIGPIKVAIRGLIEYAG